MFGKWFQVVRTAVLVIGVLLSFFAVMELVRAYLTLRDLHPYAGVGFLCVLGALLLLGLWWLYRKVLGPIWKLPKTLVAPQIGDLNTAPPRKVRRYGAYLLAYIERLRDNPALSAADWSRTQDAFSTRDWQIVEEGLSGRADQAPPEVPSPKEWENLQKELSPQECERTLTGLSEAFWQRVLRDRSEDEKQKFYGSLAVKDWGAVLSAMSPQDWSEAAKDVSPTAGQVVLTGKRTPLVDLKNGLTTGSGDRQREAIQRAEKEIITPLLEVLDAKADRHVRSSVRDVMVCVAVSPYKSADLMIVLYRNAAMVIRIIRIYHSRPRFREQMRILRDTMRVVATVNYLNLGGKLLEKLSAKLPGGRFLDDIAQGMGAGLMTSVAGHAAKHRCRAFRGWDEQEAKNSIGRHLVKFYKDVRGIFLTDIMGMMKDRIGGAYQAARDAVESALVSTGGMMDTFIKKPVVAGSGTIFRAVGRTVKGIFGREEPKGDAGDRQS